MESIDFRVVIPARLQSTRLPEKVLADIGGRPMLAHVCDAAKRSGATEVVVATDHERIRDACAQAGVAVEMTSPEHLSGTDRICEVADRRGWDDDDIVVNLQGDEPLMPPELVRGAAALLLEDPGAGIATWAHGIDDLAEWLDPNVVKVVRGASGRAHYFSRAPIPWDRSLDARRPQQLPTAPALRHIGLYAYRVRVLRAFRGWPPSANERSEALEQLRALDHGVPIQVGVTGNAPPRGVDTADDLAALRARFG